MLINALNLRFSQVSEEPKARRPSINSVYMGNGAYGVSGAARLLFKSIGSEHRSIRIYFLDDRTRG
jgi:hypothetical protein